MKPLKIAFLWHTHQPDYKSGNEFLLPWVRFHGIKDYYDIPAILNEFPKIKQTFNIVPSLFKQIDEYIECTTLDQVQKLTYISAENLTEQEKYKIIDSFFTCNLDNMIKPYPRYLELYEKSKNKDEAIKSLSPQDWTDIQTWYNLTWFGPISRKEPMVRRLIQKGKNFSESEKLIALKKGKEVLKRIVSNFEELITLGQVELSVSPMYHPILPLLIDSDIARESLPGRKLPQPRFNYPEDAEIQVKNALGFYDEMFSEFPDGMWPSEGSVSDETLKLLSSCGIKWAATDEAILSKSVGPSFKPTEKFFPRRFKTASGNISILFRDHFLSDRIGFTYSSWNSEDAANDFIYHLNKIREEIIKIHGEDSLDHAVVPVILDGENCWEFYPDNGLPFLRNLYSKLINNERLTTVTCFEACSDSHDTYLPTLDHIFPGSWIDSNFSIWIGQEEDRLAWEMLGRARKEVENRRDNISSEKINRTMEEIYIAEGSDWFWWYGDEHQAPNKDDFDIMFRNHIKNIYELINLPVPDDVLKPIGRKITTETRKQNEPKQIEINGRLIPEDKWDKAGYFSASGEQSSMHRSGEIFRGLYYYFINNKLFIRPEIKNQLSEGDVLRIIFRSGEFFELKASGISYSDSLDSVIFANSEVTEIGIFFTERIENISIAIETVSVNNKYRYPASGMAELK